MRCGGRSLSRILIRSMFATDASSSMPKPVAQAVMFCLMDVSGSMTEHMKDLAKRFYVLLYIFLKRRYKHVDVVFIRHTHQAQEVDEDTFFHSPETGGTVVSTALEEMLEVVSERYSPGGLEHLCRPGVGRRQHVFDNEQDRRAADGTHPADLPVLRVPGSRPRRRDFPPGFIRRESDLWQTYQAIGFGAGAPSRCARSTTGATSIPVFRELFAKKDGGAEAHGARPEGRTAAIRRSRLGVRHHPARLRCDRAHRAGRTRAQHLPEPDRGHQHRADARRLSSIGMPLFYKHWSFGKHFARNEALYRAGMQGLAYEIVINSNPCISYIMEENTATMQTLVIAHAAFGHNHFFKNNYLFKQWTDAERHPRLSRIRQELSSPPARSGTARRRSSGCSTRRTR